MTIGSRRRRCAAVVTILLVVTASIAGLGGCDGYTAPSKDLEIRTWYDLDDVRNNLMGHHVLMNDLDSTTAGYQELASPTANSGKGWDPIGYIIGEGGPIFMGIFDGQGHEIGDLYINRPREDLVGLFGCVDPGVIQDVGVVNVTVTGGDSVGGLAGVATIVTNCYSVGSVTGKKYVGGLAGIGVSVGNSYSTGDVTGTEDVGGLLGYTAGNVSNCYSTSSVTGVDKVGGLVGDNSGGNVRDSFWDVQTSGQPSSDGGTGKNTTEMQDIATFLGASWDIIAVALNETNPAYIWNIVNNVTYPFLGWQSGTR
jgi:hypothetical protein